MTPFDNKYKNNPQLLALVRFVSEQLGYTERKTGSIRSYSSTEIQNLLMKNGLSSTPELIKDCAEYSLNRKRVLDEHVRTSLQDEKKAAEMYQSLYSEFLQKYRTEKPLCSLPFNKQKGDKKKPAYLTCSINLLAEMTLRDLGLSSDSYLGFVDDPRNLAIYSDRNKNLVFTSSRRFDGAFPTLDNALLIWEIKEYYYTTTFGSRIADGVYESLLDGYEFNDLYNDIGSAPYHVLFIDAFYTWWDCGKSYLCRIIDMLNFGFVDEVIVGKEVLTRWPALLRQFTN